MLYSVVILSYNSERTLKTCLESLLNTLTQYTKLSEVFVVENGSVDNSREIISSFKEKYPLMVKPILFDENTGTTVSRNTALRQASGKYVLVLDSDAYIEKSALDILTEKLDSSSDIGMVCPQLRYGDGRYQISTDEFPTLVKKLKRFLSLDSMQKNVDIDNLTECDVDYAISACWLLSRESLNKAGYFDENIFYSPEDVDYCISMWKSGFRIRYVPSAMAIHDAQELSRGFKLSFFHFSHLAGLFYLFQKHRYFFTPSRLRRRLRKPIYEFGNAL